MPASTRILIFSISSLETNTGSPIRTRLLARGLRSLGATLSILAPGVPDDFIDTDRSEIFYLETDHEIQSQLTEAIQKFSPDVVFCSTESVAGILVSVCREFNVPCVFDMHSIGLIELVETRRWHIVRPHNLRRIWAAIKRIWSLHQATATTVANPTLLPLVRKINKRSTLVAGITDLDKFARTPKNDGKLDTIQVAYVGNFMRWQGCELLLQAARILIEDLKAPYSFRFVGGEPVSREQFIRKWSHLVQTGHVTFSDAVDYEEIPYVLGKADILVIPRPWMLTTYLAFPGKISDYMASGKAILATNLKSHRYAIEDGVSGILCQPTPLGIVDGLLRMQDVAFRDKLGENARATAEHLFSIERQSKDILSFLEDIVDNPRNLKR